MVYAKSMQAYLNLENSGRELESIVVGEIQKSYNAYAGIMKREGNDSVPPPPPPHRIWLISFFS